jgi:hypothetical protein
VFHRGDFATHTEEGVRALLRGRNARIIKGYFPASVHEATLPKLSFVHLDVDVYHATKNSLEFLLAPGVLLPRSLIVLDDYDRSVAGVNLAVREVIEAIPGTLAFPMFPGQALLIPNTW